MPLVSWLGVLLAAAGGAIRPGQAGYRARAAMLAAGAAASGQEAKLLAVLLCQADQPLHLLVVGAQLLAKLLDDCRQGGGRRGSSGERVLALAD